MSILKSITVLILCLFLGYAGEAQAKLGFRAGVTISKQQFKQGNLDVNPQSKFGLDLALLSEFELGPMVALSPELHWMQKGTKIDDLGGGLGESARTFNYLEIPVLLKVSFGDAGGVFVFGGPSIGYLFSASDKDGDGNTNDIDLHDFNRAELGAHIGAGINAGPVKFDVRYIAGFSNIANIDDNDLEVRNSGFGAGIGFMF
jgi:hypothetical protein